MSAPGRRSLAFGAGLLLAAALPILGAWTRGGAVERCARDGVRVDPRYRALCLEADGREAAYCCVPCLRSGLARLEAPPRKVSVTDEATGAEVDADAAWYVDSVIVTSPATGNTIHAFASEAEARRHAAAFRGTVLAGPGLSGTGAGSATRRPEGSSP